MQQHLKLHCSQHCSTMSGKVSKNTYFLKNGTFLAGCTKLCVKRYTGKNTTASQLVQVTTHVNKAAYLFDK